jgi:hypothetical protein
MTESVGNIHFANVIAEKGAVLAALAKIQGAQAAACWCRQLAEMTISETVLI